MLDQLYSLTLVSNGIIVAACGGHIVIVRDATRVACGTVACMHQVTVALLRTVNQRPYAAVRLSQPDSGKDFGKLTDR